MCVYLCACMCTRPYVCVCVRAHGNMLNFFSYDVEPFTDIYASLLLFYFLLSTSLKTAMAETTIPTINSLGIAINSIKCFEMQDTWS